MDVTLETPRLLLRQFRAADLDAYAELCADPEVMRYLGTGATLSRPDAWRSMAGFLGHWRLLGYGMWALELKSTGELVGRAGFLDPPGWPGFELGWTLARPHWGRGYATEAARRALAYAFEELGRDRVISLIRHGNERSAQVALRIGQKLAGEVDLLGAPARVYEALRP
ncbi:MAG TPA: GNAT family N-acetyltransferase [Usitatibacter sp.]|nr:GNAT family N-acetyltransferase [Usitatibacter sp.]